MAFNVSGMFCLSVFIQFESAKNIHMIHTWTITWIKCPVHLAISGMFCLSVFIQFDGISISKENSHDQHLNYHLNKMPYVPSEYLDIRMGLRVLVVYMNLWLIRVFPGHAGHMVGFVMVWHVNLMALLYDPLVDNLRFLYSASHERTSCLQHYDYRLA